MSRSMTGTTGKLDLNPTHTFFLQYATPATVPNQSSKSSGQSMQNLNKISKVGDLIAAEKQLDGTVSDSNSAAQIEGAIGGNKKRRPSMAKALVILGLSKKSNSTNTLAMGKRLVFPRSEEIGMTPELRNRFTSRGERDPSANDDDKSNETEEPKAR